MREDGCAASFRQVRRLPGIVRRTRERMGRQELFDYVEKGTKGSGADEE
jgi:hypothetical protein